MGVLGANSNVLGGVFTATASGAIANGKACKINSDGTVSQAVAEAGRKLFIAQSDRVWQFRTKTAFTTSLVLVPEASGTWGTMGTADSNGAGYRDQYYTSIQERESSVKSIQFNNDGTKFFTTGESGDDVNEYTLSTAYDLDTLSFVDSYDISAKTGNPGGLFFKTDGTEMYVIDRNDGEIHQWTLSTGFDVSTSSFTRTFDPNRDNDARGIIFKPDGTKMYFTTDTNNRTDQYTLSTAWDISTASYDSVSLVQTDYNTNPTEIAFNDDGTKFFVLGYSSFEIVEYTLSTAYDLSTASFLSENYIVGAYFYGMCWGAGVAADNDNYIGISQGAFSNGETAVIKTVGNIDTNQSGLTANATCFIADDGSITSTDTKFVAGHALSLIHI